MGIERIPIRAKIIFDGNLEVITPYILSFSVNRQRGSYSTFSASLKVLSKDVVKITGKTVIWAGEKNDLKKIFTGIIKKKSQSPCWDDPSYQVISVNGADELVKLEGMKFTRRQFISDTSWVKITGVSPGLKSGKLKLTNKETLSPNDGSIPGKDMGWGTQAVNSSSSTGELSTGKSTAKRPPIIGKVEIVEDGIS